MSYIGNAPISAAFLTDTFSGNGSTVAFTMTVAPANTSSILVSVTGVLQSPDTYSVSGTTLTFSAAPPSGTSNISVRYLGIPASGVTTTAYRTVTNFTATAGQTSFSVPSYTVGYIDVYRNGVRLVSTDYTATTGTTVVLNNACTVGDSVVTESFLVSSVLNAIPATAGAVAGSYLAGGAVTLTTQVTGILPVANGGTGLSSGMPAFSYQNTTGQSITSTTWTKVTVNSQIFDTNSNVSSSRFTATIAGYYQFNGCIRCAGSSLTGIVVSLYKNGSIVGYGNAQQSSVAPDNSINVSEVISLAVGDYVELYGFIIGTSPSFAYAAAGANARFSGAMIRAA